MSHRWPAAPAANGAWRLAQDSGAGVARGSGERPLGIDGVLPQAIRGHPVSSHALSLQMAADPAASGGESASLCRMCRRCAGGDEPRWWQMALGRQCADITDGAC